MGELYMIDDEENLVPVNTKTEYKIFTGNPTCVQTQMNLLGADRWFFERMCPLGDFHVIVVMSKEVPA